MDVRSAAHELNTLRPELLIALRKVLRLASAAVVEVHMLHCVANR